MALLLAKKVIVLGKYSDFADVFLEESANVFPEHTRVNEHAIELQKGKQSPYRPIYSPEPVDLKIFKTYIETSLANGFIGTLKSPVSAPILFVHKLNDSLHYYVNYWKLNNIIIKNQYLFLLINESPNWLG